MQGRPPTGSNLDYNDKLLSILNDKSKFKQLQENPTEKREASLQRYLCLLHKQSVFPCGSNPSRIYRLPKIHKSGAPLRPIVSAIGSYSHNLAKYLTRIIKQYANNEYTVKDSFSFVNELLCWPSVPFMCSFDIVSLFTNIPINETIEICLDKLYKDMFGR